MELKGRVKKDKRAKLRKFLYAERPPLKKEGGFGLKALTTLGGKDKKKPLSKK